MHMLLGHMLLVSGGSNSHHLTSWITSFNESRKAKRVARNTLRKFEQITRASVNHSA